MSRQLAVFASLVGMAMAAALSSTTTGTAQLATSSTAVVPLTSTGQTTATSLAAETGTTSATKSASAAATTPASRLSTTHVPSSTSTTSTPAAKTFTIAVGENGLYFTPNTVSADVGDSLLFSFYPQNHSVALGTWDQGCAPAKEGGFFSGFVPVDDEDSRASLDRSPNSLSECTADRQLATFQVKVETADPMVFYCTAGRQCQDGMYGVVNPSNDTSSTDETLAAYAVRARNASSNVSPSSVFGGTLAFNGTAISVSNGTVCGLNSGNITSASSWCVPEIVDISSSAAFLKHSLWTVMTVAILAYFL